MKLLASLRCGSLLAALLAVPVLSSAQATDTEPNNSCPGAQPVGAPAQPFVIDGVVSGAPGSPDIDFFRFGGAPGTAVQLELRGENSGAGTLTLPLLGVFDETCSFISVVDPFSGVDPRAVFRVPMSGQYTAAVTAYPDFGFTGVETTGSYQLVLSRPEVVESIGGRLVNALTGQPVTGDFPNFGAAYLLFCTDALGCNFINGRTVESDGTFLFDSRGDGQPLIAGRYQVYAVANGFAEFYSGIFDAADGEVVNLGDLPLEPFRVIGSVSVRLLDAFSGSPLPGFSPPFAFAELQRCEGEFCFGLAGAQADFEGRVVFEGALFQLPPGEYRVIGTAEDYRQAMTERFMVAESEHVNVGDLRLEPFPILFGPATGCELSTAGGFCTFGVQVTNRGNSRFTGEAWATANYFKAEHPFRSATFQIGRRGTDGPRPERLRLRRGETTQLEFTFPIPAGQPEGSSLCVTAVVGTGPQPQFENQGDRFLFCAGVFAGQLQILPAEEGRKRFRDRDRATDAMKPRRRH